jgi:hypothetical protein
MQEHPAEVEKREEEAISYRNASMRGIGPSATALCVGREANTRPELLAYWAGENGLFVKYENGPEFKLSSDVPGVAALAQGENELYLARRVIETATGEGWSLRRLQERVLRVAARVLIHGRRAILVISHASAPLWRALWSKLGHFRLAD